MELTPENKAHIDSLSIRQLLGYWRSAPAGDPWFQGETGEYWEQRMGEKRAENNDAYVRASKDLGWWPTDHNPQPPAHGPQSTDHKRTPRTCHKCHNEGCRNGMISLVRTVLTPDGPVDELITKWKCTHECHLTA